MAYRYPNVVLALWILPGLLPRFLLLRWIFPRALPCLASSWRAPSAPPLLTPPDQLSRGQRILPLKLKVPKGVKNGINQHKSMEQKDRYASSEGSPRHRTAPLSGKDKWFPNKAESRQATVG